MDRMVDLTGKIEEGLWDYNTLDLNGACLPQIRVQRIASILENGFDAHRLDLTTLSGTCLETAAHMIPGRPTIDQVPVESFVVQAHLLRLPYVGPGAVIGSEDLSQQNLHLEPGEALMIDTGWWRLWNKPGYITQAPRFSEEALPWLIDQPFSILGLDTPVADKEGEILLPLFEKGMLMVAPLVNLGSISKPAGTLLCFPLNIAGVCSTPCRAVWMERVLGGNNPAF